MVNFGSLVNSVKSSFVDTVKSAASTVGDVIKQDSFVSELRGTLTKSVETVSNAYNLATSAQKDLREAIDNAINKGKSVANSANTLLTQKADQYFNSLKQEVFKNFNVTEWANKFEHTISHDFIGELTGYMNNGQKQLTTTFKSLSEKGASFMSGIQEISTNVSGEISSSLFGMSANLANFANQAESTLNGIGNQALNTLSGFGNQAMSTLNGLGNQAVNTLNGLGNQTISTLNGFGNQAMNTINGLGNQAMNTLNGLGNQAMNTLTGMGNQAMNTLNGWGNQAMSALNDAGSQAYSYGVKTLKSVEDFGNKVYTEINSFGNNVYQMGNNIYQMGNDAYQTVSHALTENVGQVTEMFESGLNSAKQGFSVVKSTVMGKYNAAVSTLNSLGSKAATTYQQITGNVGDVLQNAVSKGKNAIQDGLGTIGSSLESIEKSVKNSSIVKDIQKLPGEAISAVNNAVKSAGKTLSKLFGR